MKVFVFDTSICNGCYCCQIACKDEHCGNDWTPYAKPQPETGQFWLKLSEYVRGTIPKVKVHYVATLCNHCDEPDLPRRMRGRGRHLQARRRPGHHRPGSVHRLHQLRVRLPLSGDLHERFTRRSPRNAPGAPTCWTRAGRSRAAWTPVPPVP